MRLPRHTNIKQRILTPVFISLVAFTLIAIAGAYWQKYRGIEHQIKNQHEYLYNLYQEAISADTQLLNALLDPIEESEAIRKAWRQRDRAALLRLTQPLLTTLRTRYRVTHFYFMDLDRVNFLRVHQPPRHGDLIARITMQQAAATGKPSHGVELGPLGTLTLRVVRPWYIDGELAGYLELGEEIGHIMEKLKKSRENHVFFTIDKRHLQREAWESGQRMLGHTPNWDEYPDFITLRNHADLTPAETKEQLDSLHSTNRGTHPITLSHRAQHAIPLLDAGKHRIGDMILVHNTDDENLATFNYVLLLGAIATLITVPLMFFFSRYISTIARDLDNSRKIALREAQEKIEALAKTNEFKTAFLANISHEIRTPMNGILGMLQLTRDTPLTETQQHYMDIANDSCEHLLTLLNDLLDHARIESGQLQLESIDFNLQKLCHDVATSSMVLAQNKGLTLECIIHPDTPVRFEGDPTRIRQVLSNLITNAIKFTREGGVRLHLSPLPAGGAQPRMKFEIIDTGIGITEEQQQYIFDSFTQADDSTTRIYGGTGLGLSIVKYLVEQMGGKIELQSTPGKGSTFSFTLPIKEVRRAQPVRIETSLEEIRVLVAGHSEGDCTPVSKMLDELKITHSCAENIELCIHSMIDAASSGNPFHIIVVDSIGLSRLELKLAHAIRHNPTLRNTRLILIVNAGIRGDAYMAHKSGFHAYLTHPVDTQQLYNCINAMHNMTGNQLDNPIVTRHTLTEMSDFQETGQHDEAENEGDEIALIEEAGEER